MKNVEPQAARAVTPVKKRIAHTFKRNLEERENNDALHPGPLPLKNWKSSKRAYEIPRQFFYCMYR